MKLLLDEAMEYGELVPCACGGRALRYFTTEDNPNMAALRCMNCNATGPFVSIQKTWGSSFINQFPEVDAQIRSAWNRWRRGEELPETSTCPECGSALKWFGDPYPIGDGQEFDCPVCSAYQSADGKMLNNEHHPAMMQRIKELEAVLESIEDESDDWYTRKKARDALKK